MSTRGTPAKTRTDEMKEMVSDVVPTYQLEEAAGDAANPNPARRRRNDAHFIKSTLETVENTHKVSIFIRLIHPSIRSIWFYLSFSPKN